MLVADFLASPAPGADLVDSPANFAANITDLAANVADIASITLTSNPTAAEALTFDPSIFTFPNLTIEDTAANLISHLDALNTLLFAGSPIAEVTITDSNPWVVTAYQMTMYFNIIYRTTGTWTITCTTPVTVYQLFNNQFTSYYPNLTAKLDLVDTSANLVSAFDNLPVMITYYDVLNSIKASDTVTALLTSDQVTADAAASAIYTPG